MKKFNRRQFLRGLGGYTLALPFLPSLLPAGAKAQLTTPPKRFIGLATFDGYFEYVYYPSLEPDVKVAEDIWYRKLANISGPMTEAHGTHFDPFRNKMNIYRGLDIVTGKRGHGIAHMLTAARREIYGDSNPSHPEKNSISMDNVLLRSKNFYPTAPSVPAIRASGWATQPISFDRTEAGEPFKNSVAVNSKQLFSQVFGGDIVDPETAKQIDTNRLKIGDLVLEDFKRKLNSRRISSADKATLSDFVDEVHQLQARIEANFGKVCTEPTITDMSRYFSFLNYEEKIQMYKDYMDIVVAAFKCDLSRVATISVLRSFLNDHANSHKSPYSREAQLIYINNTLAVSEIFAYLLNRMDSEVESNGTMLDNSLVFWGSDISEGYAHSVESMPAISFGSAGGKINTGYYIDYRQRPFYYPSAQTDEPPIGRSYTQLLITFMKALGLQPEEYYPYGDGGGFGSFDAVAAKANGLYEPYEKYRNDPLPIIYKG